jgi:V-type H+-transporting ATPase subunit a
MKYCNLILPRESAWEILNSLGELSCLQFIDQDPLSAYYSRPFSNFLRRCEDLRLKLDSIESESLKWDKTVLPCKNYSEFLKSRRQRDSEKSHQISGRREFDELEEEITEKRDSLFRQLEYYEEINKRRENLKEERIVLQKFYEFVGSRKEIGLVLNEEETPRKKEEETGRVEFLSGIIGKEEEASFQRIIWRVSKGNALSQFAEGNEEEDLEFVKKVSFIGVLILK